jgi:hypothetical protein
MGRPYDEPHSEYGTRARLEAASPKGTPITRSCGVLAPKPRRPLPLPPPLLPSKPPTTKTLTPPQPPLAPPPPTWVTLHAPSAAPAAAAKTGCGSARPSCVGCRVEKAYRCTGDAVADGAFDGVLLETAAGESEGGDEAVQRPCSAPRRGRLADWSHCASAAIALRGRRVASRHVATGLVGLLMVRGEMDCMPSSSERPTSSSCRARAHGAH